MLPLAVKIGSLFSSTIFIYGSWKHLAYCYVKSHGHKYFLQYFLAVRLVNNFYRTYL